jgi:hypothetical protein
MDMMNKIIMCLILIVDLLPISVQFHQKALD